jgi:hypothetical protein
MEAFGLVLGMGEGEDFFSPKKSLRFWWKWISGHIPFLNITFPCLKAAFFFQQMKLYKRI